MPQNEEKRLRELRERNRQIVEHSGAYSPLELIEKGNAKRYSNTRVFRKYLLAACLVLAVVILSAAAIFVFLRVEHVTVDNETDFSAEEVRAASGIHTGQNLLLLDKRSVADNIARKIPYADSIVVTKQYPSTVKISLKKGEAAYYIRKGEHYYVLSKAHRVLACTENVEQLELSGAIRLESNKISRCIVGESLGFSDEDLERTFAELEERLEEHGYFGFCTALSLNSKFDLRFVYKGRLLIKLGDLYDLDIKLQFVDKIMETLNENDSGEIDVTDRDLHEGILTLY